MTCTATQTNLAKLPDPARNHQTRIENLEDRIAEQAAHIHAATYRLLELIREYDECKGWSGPGMRSCAHWLNWKCGISIGAAREKVRVAHALKDLPLISADFRGGKVSYSKVRAMSRVATADNEDYLLDIARHGTATHVERLVRKFRLVKRLEVLEAENRRHDLRELSWHVDDDGCWQLKGRFTPEQGALIQKALETAMEDLFDEQQEQDKNVPAGTSADEISPRSDSITVRRADALARVAEASLSNPTGNRSGGDGCLIHVHTEMEALRADGDSAESELDGQANVSAETSRRLACDACVVHWRNNEMGETLNIGRKTRTIPPSIRRALKKRDYGCRFPGCTCNKFVDAHHIKHWADGGETSLQNLVLMCRYHHRLIHEGGFSVEMNVSGQPQFMDQIGQIIPVAAQTRSRGNVFALMSQNQRDGIQITPETTVPDWHGEKMDDDLAVSGLLSRES